MIDTDQQGWTTLKREESVPTGRTCPGRGCDGELYRSRWMDTMDRCGTCGRWEEHES